MRVILVGGSSECIMPSLGKGAGNFQIHCLVEPVSRRSCESRSDDSNKYCHNQCKDYTSLHFRRYTCLMRGGPRPVWSSRTYPPQTCLQTLSLDSRPR